ncbi:hypothetical protein KFE94_12235 [bacterium SCSIO 12643]|nr:hypothetical protein KFE94_12235 [bacterium SCSIO 12643]
MKNLHHYMIAGLALILFFGNSEVQAQKKCKFDFEETDPFSGKVKKGNTSTLVAGMGYSTWYVGWNREGDSFYMGMLVTMQGEFNTSINQGDSLMFKLANGNMVTVYAKEQSTPVTNVSTASTKPVILSTYRCNYAITKEQLEMLSESVITHVRMNIADKVIQKELKEKKALKVQNDIKCILK